MVRSSEHSAGGEQTGANPFDQAKAAFNNALLSGSYEGSVLSSALQSAFTSVNEGLRPTDRTGKASRYGMVTVMCEQAADMASRNGDELSATAFRAHQETFGAMSELLGQPKPADPLPPASKTSGAKS